MGSGASDNKTKSFQGEGRRLGTVNEAAFGSGAAPTTMPIQRGGQDDSLPQPSVDPNLDEAQRKKIRADRAVAAEARLKKQKIPGQKKTKKKAAGEPLRGPNSEPLMRWTS